MFLRRYIFAATLLTSLLMASCKTELPYLSDAEREVPQTIVNSYTPIVYPGDRLYIHVSSNSPESVVPFNEETNKSISSDLAEGIPVKPKLSGYLVSDLGKINFPLLGEIEVGGLSLDSAATLIAAQLVEAQYVNDPMVMVRYMNFRVAVLGEVAQPQELQVNGDRLTIFEALARCGDITPLGKKSNVMVVRCSDSVTVARIDLTSKDLLSSPYYYLRQHDVVYIDPIEKQKRRSTRDDNLPTYLTMGTGLISTGITMYRYFIGILQRQNNQ